VEVVMFIISTEYLMEIDKVEELLEDHRNYLSEQYTKKNFIAAGRKNPRTGGIILSGIN